MSCVLHGVQRDCSGKAAHTTGFTAEQHLLQCGGGGAIVGEVHFGVAIDGAAAVLVLVRDERVLTFLNVDCLCLSSTFLWRSLRGSM